LTGGEPSGRLSIPLPSYESSFRTLSVRVRPDRPLTADPTRDATTVMQAIRRGHVYIAVDGVASPPAFEFTASNASGTARQGDELPAGGPVTVRLRSNAPSSFQTMLWRDGTLLTTARDESEMRYAAPAEPGIYRAAIVAPPEEGSVPWVVSNPIYVGVRFQPPSAAATVVSSSRVLFDGRTTKWWRTETDPASLAAIDLAQTLSGGELRMRYGLSGGSSAGQYAALGLELPNGAAPFDRVTFTARTEQPVRIAVQFLPLGRAEGWERSLYIDNVSRSYTIRFDEATPIITARMPHPAPENIHDILFVVDIRHAKPGASSLLWLKSAELQR